LLRVADKHGARFTYASTSEVYGDPEQHPQREEYNGNVNPVGPRACYDEAKRYGEALVTSYARQHDVSYGMARIFNTYGPRLRKDDGRVISNFLWQGLNDEDITVYGDGSQTRSFCYVDDLVRGLHLLMEADDDTICNLGNPAERTILDLAKTVQEILDTSSSIVHEELPEDDPSRRKPDISRAADRLGWSPSVDLEEGLGRTASWFHYVYA
jgi:dTDP-glucose 4,6-dehydratase